MKVNDSQAVQIDGVWYLVCEWFARCENVTRRAVKRPILNTVPTCDRCAWMAGYAVPKDMIDIDFVIES